MNRLLILTPMNSAKVLNLYLNYVGYNSPKIILENMEESLLCGSTALTTHLSCFYPLLKQQKVSARSRPESIRKDFRDNE